MKEVESIRCRQATESYIAGPHAGTAVIHFDGNGREGGMAMCGTAMAVSVLLVRIIIIITYALAVMSVTETVTDFN